MPLPMPFNYFDIALKEVRVNELLATNEKIKESGLYLTPVTAAEVLTARDRSLKAQGRVELDLSVTKLFIDQLSISPYIRQENFVTTLTELYEVFHYIKNFSSDFIPDEDIIKAIMVYFNETCGGSTELLMGKGIEKILNNFKAKRDLSEIVKEEEEED